MNTCEPTQPQPPTQQQPPPPPQRLPWNPSSRLPRNCTNGNFLWAKSFGGNGYSEGKSIALDISGNVYTTGVFSGTVDFDPGAGTTNFTSNGGNDVFVQKIDPQGNLLWVKCIGGSGPDKVESIIIDVFGSVYTTGSFIGTVDFDPNSGISTLTAQGNLTSDSYIQKLDSGGNFLWAKSFGGVGNDLGSSITVDLSGNIYTTGVFLGTVDFDPGAGTTNLTSNGNKDVFIQKMDSSGNFLWAESFGGSNSDDSYSITVNALGDVYATGYFNDTVSFNPGAGTTGITSNGSDDVFVLKMSQLNTGVNVNNFDHKLTVYPNPTPGNFSIDLGSVHESSIVTITDISGKLIETKTITQSQVLNLSIEEPVGIYFVSIQTGNRKATIGLVKE